MRGRVGASLDVILIRVLIIILSPPILRMIMRTKRRKIESHAP
jgi:hypothetical protein